MKRKNDSLDSIRYLLDGAVKTSWGCCPKCESSYSKTVLEFASYHERIAIHECQSCYTDYYAVEEVEHDEFDEYWEGV